MTDIGTGQAAAAAVTGWIDRRPAAVRDLLVAVVTAVIAGSAVLTQAVTRHGWEVLADPGLWIQAGELAVAGLLSWALMVLTTVTRRYGTGAPGYRGTGR